MTRKYIYCRDYPGDLQCTVAISADSEEELIEAVVQHGVSVHGYEDTPQFREMVRKGMKEAGPRPTRLSPPEFRETFCKEMKEGGPRRGRFSRWRAA